MDDCTQVPVFHFEIVETPRSLRLIIRYEGRLKTLLTMVETLQATSLRTTSLFRQDDQGERPSIIFTNQSLTAMCQRPTIAAGWMEGRVIILRTLILTD